jgi:hypothetical protein
MSNEFPVHQNLIPNTYQNAGNRLRNIKPIEWWNGSKHIIAYTCDKKLWEYIGEEVTVYEAINIIRRIKGYDTYFFPGKVNDGDNRVNFIRHESRPDFFVWWLAIYCE